MEIGSESINKDHSHSWVRISQSLKKLVSDLIDKEEDDNEQETSEMQFEIGALKTNVLAVASRLKAKAKPQRRVVASVSTKTMSIEERKWTDIEPEDYSSEKGHCSKGETSAVSGMRVMIVHQNRHVPSHPSHEVEGCRSPRQK